MPKKYVIHCQPASPRFRIIGQLGIVDWREDCSSCHNCVKKNCVFHLYRDEAAILHDEVGILDYIYGCKGCLVCVQNCTKNLLTRVVNPEYKRLGDSYYTPEIILTTWYQSETGKIPVSGSGYGGKFSGPGFDSMWTDMSEIVRPTRDGIHGREYINTSVDIGRKLSYLSFKNKDISLPIPPRIESPVPLMFNILPQRWDRGPVKFAITKAAKEMDLFSVVKWKGIENDPHFKKESFYKSSFIVPFLETINDKSINSVSHSKMVIIPDSKNIIENIKLIKNRNKEQIVAIYIHAKPKISQRILELTKQGAEVIFLKFENNGLEKAESNARHMRDILRKIHTTLVKDALRDQITIIAASGIALAEHMAKAIICGADLVSIDIPLLLALECRLCMECERGELCQIDLKNIETDYAVTRIKNLIMAWRNQLLELMGAMGLREVRRLRGETGRCMFFEDLEQASFGKLFGKRKDEESS